MGDEEISWLQSLSRRPQPSLPLVRFPPRATRTRGTGSIRTRRIPAPEHERLSCARGAELLVCQYDKVKGAGYHLDNTVARFKGHDVTASWTCPTFFPGPVCDNVHRVWGGRARYWPASGGSFEVDQQMVIVDWGGQKVMFQYWVGQFACPWYRTFNEASEANSNLNFDCIE